MTIVRGIATVVLRVAVFAAIHLAFLAVLARSESTDALGAGLLFFLVVFIVALVWAGVDASRRGFLSAAIVWVVTAVLAGVALTLVFVLTSSDSYFGEEWAGSTLFFGLLVLIPALVGSGLGGLLQRAHRPAVNG